MTEFLQLSVAGLSISAVYALIGADLTLIYGVSRVMDFAQGMYLILGGFIAYALVGGGVPYLAAVPAAALAIAALAVVVHSVLLRRVGLEALSVFIVTVGLGVVLSVVAVKIWGPGQVIVETPYTGTVAIGEVLVRKQSLFLFAITVPVLAGVFVLLRHSDLGRSLRATAENQTMASLVGVNVRANIRFAYALGSGLAGLGGALIGGLFSFDAFSGGLILAKGFAVALGGGLGSLPGAVLMALLLGMGETYATGYGITAGPVHFGPEWRDAYGFLIMILVILIRPEGLLRGGTGDA